MRLGSRSFVVLVATVVVAACGDCGEDPVGDGPETDDGAADGAVVDGMESDGGADGNPSDSTARDSMTPIDSAGDDTSPPTDGATDGATDGETAIDTGPSCSSGELSCGDQCVDPRRNPNHCGACGNSCSGKEVCTKGSCICPRYHDRCNGSCVPTHTDPDNCGRCGKACSGDKVCSSASCAIECLPGREACGRTCVDTKTDPDHCGGCGDSCEAGEGCIDGGCEPAVEVGDAPAKCAGGGPQIGIQARTDGEQQCLGNVAKNVFRWAACSCDGLLFDNKVRTDAYDSALGRYQPGGLGGSVGTNRSLQANNEVHVRGAVWASGSGGATFANTTEIFQQLHVGGDATFRNTTDVRDDGWIEGDVVSGSSVTFHRDLHVNQNASVSGSVSYNNLDRTTVDVPNACERCGAAERIPVGDIVEAHDGTSNDNDLINLDPDALVSQAGERVLVLPCGEYYLSSIDVTNKTTILARGRTALYVGGDVDIGNEFTIKPSASGELDVFIAGDVTIGNKSRIGDPAYPASTRFYVGGEGGWHLQNSARIGAYIYAVPGGIVADNKLNIFGGVYTQSLDAGNEVDIHYDRAVLDAGKNCTPIEPDLPNPDLDAGTGDGGGGSDGASMDSGGSTTPMCAESGESCSTDDDCCVPLVCGAAGTCDVKECRAQNESCSEDADCCSGTCAQVSGQSVCVGS